MLGAHFAAEPPRRRERPGLLAVASPPPRSAAEAPCRTAAPGRGRLARCRADASAPCRTAALIHMVYSRVNSVYTAGLGSLGSR
jgi:hypothetical protein